LSTAELENIDTLTSPESDQAAELAALWNSRSAENRARLVDALVGDGLMAVWVFDLLPPRDESNDKNELAFALADHPGFQAAGTGLAAVAERAGQLARIWTGRALEERAGVLREIHDNGILAIWMFDLLPPDKDSTARFELANTLIALRDAMPR